jgi:hypothetical protein
VVHADNPRGGTQSGVRRVLREFLSPFVSIRRVARFWLQAVGWIVCLGRPDCPRGADCPRCSPGPSEFPR